MIEIKRSELENLNQHELAAMARKLQQVEEASKSRTLESYLETAHAGQLAFHRVDKRWRMVFSGNRWGKSTAGMVELLWLCLGRHPFRKCPVPIKAMILATDFENHVKNIIEPKLLQWAPRGSIVDTERNQQGALRKAKLSTGSTIDILSQDQDIKVFEGSDYDVVWIDEPCKRLIFNAIWRGLTDRGGIIYLTGTPITEPWLYQEFQKAQDGDPLRWAVCGSTSDNAVNLGEGDKELGLKRIEELAQAYDPEERSARLDGQHLQMHGLIFKTWKPAHHLIQPFPWPYQWPILLSLDPHPKKPWGYSFIGTAEDDTKILIKSGYIEGDAIDVGNELIRICQNLGIEHDKKPRITRVLIDNYASAPLMTKSFTDPTARRTSILQEINNIIGPPGFGLPSVTTAPKDVSQKIDLMKTWLRIKETDRGPRSSFYVFDTPENQDFVYEIENYVWDMKRGSIRNGTKDKPLKEDDDIIDTVMQAALTIGKQSDTQAKPLSITNRGQEAYRIHRGDHGRRTA